MNIAVFLVKHGLCNSSEYSTYHAARQRCLNPRDARFADYGGRGIEFRFASFQEFYAVLGPRPAGLQLDRINNDGHYEPGNVRWITSKQQAANRRPHPFKGRKTPHESNHAKVLRLIWGRVA